MSVSCDPYSAAEFPITTVECMHVQQILSRVSIAQLCRVQYRYSDSIRPSYTGNVLKRPNQSNNQCCM